MHPDIWLAHVNPVQACRDTSQYFGQLYVSLACGDTHAFVPLLKDTWRKDDIL